MKKIFLTSAICMCAVIPAFADDPDIAPGATSTSCETNVLSTTEDPASLTALWTPNSYECAPGTFLDKSATTPTCVTCPAGSYCEGGTYTFADEDSDWVANTAGQYLCSYNDSDFPNSAAGTSSANLCYFSSTVSCAALNPYTAGHGTASYANASASYKAYSDWGTPDDPELYAGGYFLDTLGACAYTLDCDAGYHATTPGVLVNYVSQPTIWDDSQNLVRFKSLNGTGSNKGDQTGLSNGQFEVKWSDGTTVSGMATCSTTPGEWVGNGEGNTTLPSTELTAGQFSNDNASGMRYCWCNMTNYSVAGGATQTVASPSWVFFSGYGSASDCAAGCASNCASYVQSSSGFRSSLFGSLGANPSCQGNNIGLTWYSDNVNLNLEPSSCTYGETFNLPPEPTKKGYSFGGWKVRGGNN